MKKLVLILLFLLLMNLASAVEIKLSKEIYAPEETLQAEIYGNFIDGLDVDNIFFYRERNIPVDYDLLKTEEKYFLYAILPPKQGNYTIKIKNTRYETDTGVSTEEIIKEFQIQQTNETVLTINPGFIVARDDFYIKITTNKNAEIEAEFLGEKQSVSLIQGREKKIYFSVSEIKNYTESNIKIKDYDIPVFIFPERSDVIIKETGKFRFSPLEINAVILEDDIYFFKVLLMNLKDTNIKDIIFSSNASEDLNIEIIPSSFSELAAGEKKSINLTLAPEKKGIFYGTILASSGTLSAELKLNIESTENKSKISYEGPGYEESCSDLGGSICTLTERCDGTSIFTEDGYCCQGNCIAEKEKKSNWIYGLIIIIAVIGGLILLAVYTKKKQKKSVDILKQKESSYQERMSGEVSGELSRT